MKWLSLLVKKPVDSLFFLQWLLLFFFPVAYDIWQRETSLAVEVLLNVLY